MPAENEHVDFFFLGSISTVVLLLVISIVANTWQARKLEKEQARLDKELAETARVPINVTFADSGKRLRCERVQYDGGAMHLEQCNDGFSYYGLHNIKIANNEDINNK